jgi:hypothetical protein
MITLVTDEGGQLARGILVCLRSDLNLENPVFRASLARGDIDETLT